MDNSPRMEGFYKLDPEAGAHTHAVDIADLITALDATTQLLDDVIGDAGRDEQLQGLAIAARIFAGMIADRYSGEDVIMKRAAGPRRPPGTRKQKPKGNVVTLVRESSQGVSDVR